jgi:hypothetical protein
MTAGREDTRAGPVGHLRTFVAWVLVAASLAIPGSPVLAQEAACQVETEPNDDPGVASFVSLPGCIDGSLAGSDTQDLMAWGVDGPAIAWTFELTGVPGAITSVQLLPVISDPSVSPPVLGSRIWELQSELGAVEPMILRDVLVTPGRYVLGVARSPFPDEEPPDPVYRLAVTPGAPMPPNGDVEPNDDAASAVPVSDAFALAGDHAGSRDVYVWTVSPAEAGAGWYVAARTSPESSLTLQLADDSGRTQVTVASSGAGLAEIPDLDLRPGTYLLSIDAAPDGERPYVLSAERLPVAAEADPEPNDQVVDALPIGAGEVRRGRLSRRDDRDMYVLTVDEALAGLQLDIKLMAPTGPARTLCLAPIADGSTGVDLGCTSGQGAVAMPGFLLPPGSYAIVVSGTESAADPFYLRVDGTSAPAPDYEVEPNDTPALATPMEAATTMRARLHPLDTDMFRVRTDGEPQLWQVDVGGGTGMDVAWTRGDGTVLGRGQSGDGGTSATLPDMYLAPGEHWFRVKGVGEYTLRLTPLGPPDPSAEREPNDSPAFAEPIRIGEERTGRLAVGSDVDLSRLSVTANEHLRFHLQRPPSGWVEMGISGPQGWLLAPYDVPPGTGEASAHDLFVPAGDYEIRLATRGGAEGRYRLLVERLDPYLGAAAEDPSRTDAPVDLALALDHDTVAAYWPRGQEVPGTLTLTNPADDAVAVSLDAVASHPALTLAVPEGPLELAGGETRVVPVTLRVAPDAWADIPVRLTVRAHDEAGSAATAFVEVTPDGAARPITEAAVVPIPEAILGGLDVSALAFGGAPVAPLDPTAEAQPHDRMVSGDSGLVVQAAELPVVLTLDLAGDDPVPVAGTILNPLSRGNRPSDVPRAFTLLLSEDGIGFEPVLSGELSPYPVDQGFALPAPVSARAAQLRIDSTWGDTGGVTLGEWKVVATPGAPPPGGEVSLADPALGGHVARLVPQAAVQADAEAILLTDAQSRPLTLPAGVEPGVVIGFGDGRAARLARLEWSEAPGTDPASSFGTLGVAVSTVGPAGPWTELGTWDHLADAGSDPRSFDLAPPPWARYVRLTGTPRDQDGTLVLPQLVRVIEAPADGVTYRSAAGEWGSAAFAGPLEWLADANVVEGDPSGPDPDPGEVTTAPDAGDAPDSAQPLEAGQTARGTVQRGQDDDWYVVAIPDGHEGLELTLDGTPTVGSTLALETDDGHPIPATAGPGERPGSVAYRAAVEPGSSVRVRVEQPPSSVAILFDTSISVYPYLPYVYGALRAFTDDIVEGSESILMLPFEEPPLLDEWSDQRYVLQDAVNRYINAGSSSSAEAAMVEVLDDLALRPGARAILLLTDAETSSYQQNQELWRLLDAVRPAIYTVQVGPAIPESRHFMLDWAAVGGGAYQYAVGHADVDRAFARMATQLRRPADYRLSLVTSREPPPLPEPARISVTSPTATGSGAPPSVAPGVGVALVLDTSGSMLERMPGGRRIDVARAALSRLVADGLPDGVPVSLRVFRQKRRSCDTELAVPLAPLDRAAMLAAIDGLAVKRTVRTPLAAAIEAVATDLAGLPGPHVVVVVSDGQESCGGDPAAAVQALRSEGFDVTLNIIGLDLDRKTRRALTRVADAGGGTYLDAQDADGLADAIARAVGAPFQVLDSDGVVVGSGTVGGEAVSVPPGTYRVEVRTDPPVTWGPVAVETGRALTLELASELAAP